MTALAATAWYVYAVLPPGAVTPDSAAAILPGAPVSVIGGEAGSLAALVSLVPRALFVPDDPASRAAEPDWVAARAAAHHEVVAQAHAAGPCLPLGFGTLFASSSGVHAWLAEQAPLFRPALEQVTAHQEWAVTLTEDADVHTGWLRSHDSTLMALAASIDAAGPGAAFLISRRLDKAVQSARTAHGADAAAQAGARLAEIGKVLAEPVSQGAVAGWSVLAPAHLDMHAVLAEIVASLTGTGLGLRATGPWPAYAFTRAAWQGGRDG